MDVAQVVNFSGVISALFALLAGIALAVELGRKPGAKKKEHNTAEPKGKSKDKKSDVKVAESVEPAVADSAALAKTAIPVRPFDNVQSVEAGSVEQVGIRPGSSESFEHLSELQRTYVDGLLCSRNKYDVALAILNEYQAAASVTENQDSGVTMATQAYLSATRSGSAAAVAVSKPAKKPEKSEKKEKTEGTAGSAARKTRGKRRTMADGTEKPGRGDRKKTLDGN